MPNGPMQYVVGEPSRRTIPPSVDTRSQIRRGPAPTSLVQGGARVDFDRSPRGVSEIYSGDHLVAYVETRHPQPLSQASSLRPGVPRFREDVDPHAFDRDIQIIAQTYERLHHRIAVYEEGRSSLHVGSNPLSGFHELTPYRFSHDEELCRRARTWIRRELEALSRVRWTFRARDCEEFLALLPNREALLELTISMLKTIDVDESNGEMQQRLEQYLDSHARRFLHELKSWLRSSMPTLEEWDRMVQYPQELRRPMPDYIAELVQPRFTVPVPGVQRDQYQPRHRAVEPGPLNPQGRGPEAQRTGRYIPRHLR